MINSENYVKNVLRTEPPITEVMLARLTDPQAIRLLHAGMGMVTESGEFLDMLKKHIFYGRPLDLPNAREEAGDQLWYLGLAIDVLRTTMDEVLTTNIAKLQVRFPEKFTEHEANNRDLFRERYLLEGNVDGGE